MACPSWHRRFGLTHLFLPTALGHAPNALLATPPLKLVKAFEHFLIENARTRRRSGECAGVETLPWRSFSSSFSSHPRPPRYYYRYYYSFAHFSYYYPLPHFPIIIIIIILFLLLIIIIIWIFLYFHSFGNMLCARSREKSLKIK